MADINRRSLHSNPLPGASIRLRGPQAHESGPGDTPSHDSIIIAQHDTSGFTTEAGNMQALHDAGVRTIYTEQLRDDGHQDMVNKYLSTGTMDPGLTAYLANPDRRGLAKTIEAARTTGIQVQGIDGYPARDPARRVGVPLDGGHTRVAMLNTYAFQVVQERQAALQQASPGDPRKYVMEAGASHTTTHAGPDNPVTLQGVTIPRDFPGLGDILNVPVVFDPVERTRATQAGSFSQLR